ncbi:hypothetical protein [Mangrovicoccus algicola]|uniref:Uncharacterized protein n=1 Tax=Mangrovicoccus algicola TaxID=2771008 RepID=A0A8J7CX89_9RHOB|nr:hypothetical protein [Mangrovicoccus algicola]MBE3638667.1 hypothetical protein [Mangrovicoccus algicola]
MQDPSAPPSPAAPSRWRRIFHAIPVIGWVARDIEADSANITWALVAWVAFWGCCILLFGLPGLILPALFMTAVMFVLLVLISRG